MPFFRFRGLAILAVSAVLTLAFLPEAGASEPLKNSWQRKFVEVAIDGYDPVAFFTEGRAIKGHPSFRHEWDDSVWQFANAQHRDMFVSDPEKYAPQFGGYCTSSMMTGLPSSANPEAWAIVDGKLYLFSSVGGRKRWQQNAGENINRASAVWTKLREVN